MALELLYFFLYRDPLGGAARTEKDVTCAFESRLNLGIGELGAARLAAFLDLLDAYVFFEIHRPAV